MGNGGGVEYRLLDCPLVGGGAGWGVRKRIITSNAAPFSSPCTLRWAIMLSNSRTKYKTLELLRCSTPRKASHSGNIFSKFSKFEIRPPSLAKRGTMLECSCRR
ncbi:hypothetical protein Mp_3g07370 [Marchantia polymorpha subsp. ruderalis]|uniref:Uncharacterized protein n=2 Tax=Marchantia polymorpha TaxID=3197 RepID=A0AAF6AYB9_MARPO|nr:hypothetical protein MARPO_0006s0211 [Marchantia polymorpha]BBN04753.1 hypothetical protein Mp_3g07370 [Marchantia polymorpha subsp. ruderalis]|eukprot:PTQ48198.1 hypothetical protein MARPO_0006s0211 [Marchantia polymorpha]